MNVCTDPNVVWFSPFNSLSACYMRNGSEGNQSNPNVDTMPCKCCMHSSGMVKLSRLLSNIVPLVREYFLENINPYQNKIVSALLMTGRLRTLLQ